jgi:uncharacterized DUF497 family protein
MTLFEWDEAKAESNLRKHGIAFEDAIQVFDDPYALVERDRIEDGEVRWRITGFMDNAAVLFVAHTIREVEGDEIVRIISARLATRKECKFYGQNRKKNN